MDWKHIAEVNETIRGLLEQVKVHDRQPCFGLPNCASCRVAVLLKNDMNILISEAWINAQEFGTVVRWK